MFGKHAVAYVFFDTKCPFTQDAPQICANLLKQRLEPFEIKGWPTNARQFLEGGYGSAGNHLDIRHMASHLFQSVEDSKPIFLILDGFDECQDQESRRKILRFLNAVHCQPNVRACVTSRSPVPAEAVTLYP